MYLLSGRDKSGKQGVQGEAKMREGGEGGRGIPKMAETGRNGKKKHNGEYSGITSLGHFLQGDSN